MPSSRAVFRGKQSKNGCCHVIVWHVFIVRHPPKGPCRGLAPGEPMVAPPEQPVPLLRCSEHAMHSMHSSTWCQGQSSSQRGSSTHICQEGKHDRLSWHQVVPGTQTSCREHFSRPHMSDMHCLLLHQMVPGTSLSHDDACSRSTMPGMMHIQNSFSCVCSRVGYIPDLSRLATCPGQSARFHTSRSETCPGQSARQPHSRPEACSEQCARTAKRNCSSWSCPGQTAQHHRFQSTCPGQQREHMAQSRERSASIESDLAEIKFWTFSIDAKISEIAFEMLHAA